MYSVWFFIIRLTSLYIGMCMCVRAWCDQTTGIPYVLAGFDDGSVLLWEARQPNSELTALKLYSEPGLTNNQSLATVTHTHTLSLSLYLSDVSWV